RECLRRVASWREYQQRYGAAKVGTHDTPSQRGRENNPNRLTNTLIIFRDRKTFFAFVSLDRESPSFSQKLGHPFTPLSSTDKDGRFTFDDLVGRANRFQDRIAHTACLPTIDEHCL